MEEKEKELRFIPFCQNLVKFCSSDDILKFSYVMQLMVNGEMENIPKSLKKHPVEKRSVLGFKRYQKNRRN